MLARRWEGFTLGGEERAEIGRGDELQTERGESGLEKPAFQRVDLPAGRNNNERRAFALPSLVGSLLEPALNGTLPRRVRRSGEEQRVRALRLKFQFQLHPLILAEWDGQPLS